MIEISTILLFVCQSLVVLVNDLVMNDRNEKLNNVRHLLPLNCLCVSH